MTAYYNEIDKFAVQTLRNLIAAGHIAPGIVDDRSIEDVRPADLRGFTQCHFFAGVGVWSHALRRAGWRDDRPVWTASCPCQPFSAAGQGGGFDDERHLWPSLRYLVEQCRPATVLGEQVASKDAEPWIDLVQTDLEILGYGVGAVPFPAAGVGAPHIRDRLYWVAYADSGPGRKGRAHIRGRAVGSDAQPRAGSGSSSSLSVGLANNHQHGRSAPPIDRGDHAEYHAQSCGEPGGLDNADHAGLEGHRRGKAACGGPEHRVRNASRPVGAASGACGLANAERRNTSELARDRPGSGTTHGARAPGELEGCSPLPNSRPAGPVNGMWAAADWLLCRDGKWRPVSPLPQPLVDGSSESLGRVRPEIITQVEEEINAATAQTEGGRAAAMRDLLEHLGAEAKCCWAAGGVPGLHEAPFLLAFVRQLEEQGWRIAECVSVSRPQTLAPELRGLRLDGEPPSTPCGHKLEEQPAGERADLVPFLSSLLARHAQQAWGDAHAAHAEVGFPLAHGARSRVGRLRAYGNAICAPAAQVFVESVMESIE